MLKRSGCWPGAVQHHVSMAACVWIGRPRACVLPATRGRSVRCAWRHTPMTSQTRAPRTAACTAASVWWYTLTTGVGQLPLAGVPVTGPVNTARYVTLTSYDKYQEEMNSQWTMKDELEPMNIGSTLRSVRISYLVLWLKQSLLITWLDDPHDALWTSGTVETVGVIRTPDRYFSLLCSCK